MTTFPPPNPKTPEQQLFAIAHRFRMPLEQLPGDTLRSMTERLTLALEHQIALILLALEDLAAIDLDQSEDAP